MPRTPATLPPPTARPRRARRPALAPLGVLLLSLACTVVAALYVRDDARRIDARRFGEIVDEVQQTITQRLEVYEELLYATRGELAAHGVHGERGPFATFIAGLELNRRLPGVQGVGYCARMDDGQRAAWTRELRAEGLGTFEVWPPLPAGMDAGCPVVLLEPLDWRNQRALGFDMMTEPTRRGAMEEARDSGRVASTRRVTLVQETKEDPQPGFLVYLPLYDVPTPKTVEERRAHWQGFVYSPFRAVDLFRGLSPAGARHRVDFEIYDGDQIDAAHLLYDDDKHPEQLGDPRPHIQQAVPIDVAGVRWTILFTTLPAFSADGTRGLESLVALGGVLISVLLFLIARTQALARTKAEESEAHAAALAQAAAQLGRSLDPQALAQTAAQLTTSLCAPGCDVVLVQPDGDVLWARAEAGRAAVPEVRRADELHAHPALESLLWREQGPLEQGPAERPYSSLLLAPPAAGTGRLFALPLQARGHAFGAIIFHLPESALPAERRSLCEELSRLVAGALDNARLYESAQEAVRVREEFLSIASHELKTPLTSLRLHMQSLKRHMHPNAQGPSPERLQRSIDTAERQTVRLATLVDSLLDLSRLTSGKIALEPEPLDLALIVREVSQRLAPEATTAGCQLLVEADPVEGKWDRLRLEQVVSNLLSNAIKYGPGRPVRVRVEADGPRARLRVSDEGIGISPEDIGRIFERFERAVSARHYGGLGLGLYIVRQIVDALGGHIFVESVEGHGSTFTVELPREAQPAANEPAPGVLH